jgi:hypothetical protein
MRWSGVPAYDLRIVGMTSAYIALDSIVDVVTMTFPRKSVTRRCGSLSWHRMVDHRGGDSGVNGFDAFSQSGTISWRSVRAPETREATMIKLAIAFCICLTTFSAFGQSASKYQVGTITDG